jgi:hypothetical protein
MLGIEDTYVLAAYLLCIVSTVLCALYGVVMRNRGEDAPQQEDAQWVAQEKKLEEDV